jgi:hypothetical protein
LQFSVDNPLIETIPNNYSVRRQSNFAMIMKIVSEHYRFKIIEGICNGGSIATDR